MGKLKDETGKRFGMLTVLRQSYERGHGARWICKCDCGTTESFDGNQLRAGRHTCCGCEKWRLKRMKRLIANGHSGSE